MYFLYLCIFFFLVSLQIFINNPIPTQYVVRVHYHIINHLTVYKRARFCQVIVQLTTNVRNCVVWLKYYSWRKHDEPICTIITENVIFLSRLEIRKCNYSWMFSWFTIDVSNLFLLNFKVGLTIIKLKVSWKLKIVCTKN